MYIYGSLLKMFNYLRAEQIQEKGKLSSVLISTTVFLCSTQRSSLDYLGLPEISQVDN